MINDEIFVNVNRFNDLIKIIDLTFDNIMIRCLFNVFFIINVNIKKCYHLFENSWIFNLFFEVYKI